MKREHAEKRLAELWGEIQDLHAVQELLEWDQETSMPVGGQEGRGKMMATIAGIEHRLLTAPELGDVLSACEAHAETGSWLAGEARCARQEVDHAVRVPEGLTRALAEAKSRGLNAWREAHAEGEFSLFSAALEELVQLKREEAAAVKGDGNAYDAHLDGFEPGATEEALAPLFSHLRAALTPRVREIAERGSAIDESPARGHFPVAAQLAFGREVATAIGFDFERGRLDPSTHPFCIGLHRGDVRMTWRWQEDDFRPALFGILHEAGHGLYEQGLAPERQRKAAGQAVSLGVHESQSRLWENHVGRGRGFWRWAAPRFRAHFPDSDLDPEALWPALHTVQPSRIRVEADEATYNLHIVLRFELERALFGGRLEVAELPAAWSDLSEELLGIRPRNDSEGVLQDIHWSQGLFGYFPTYTLGTMSAAQLFAAADDELGDLDDAFARGEFAPLLDWLRRKVHLLGGRYEAAELIERATGKPLAADDLLDYLEETTARVYG